MVGDAHGLSIDGVTGSCARTCCDSAEIGDCATEGLAKGIDPGYERGERKGARAAGGTALRTSCGSPEEVVAGAFSESDGTSVEPVFCKTSGLLDPKWGDSELRVPVDGKVAGESD